MRYLSLKNNKWIYVVIILLAQSAILTAKEPCCKKLLITYVDFDIMSTVDVSCSEFDTAFKGETTSRTISNSQKIKELITLLNKLKIDKKAKSVDVRMKIKLYYKHRVEVICLDKFEVLRGGHIYGMDKSLLQFIETLKSHK